MFNTVHHRWEIILTFYSSFEHIFILFFILGVLIIHFASGHTNDEYIINKIIEIPTYRIIFRFYLIIIRCRFIYIPTTLLRIKMIVHRNRKWLETSYIKRKDKGIFKNILWMSSILSIKFIYVIPKLYFCSNFHNFCTYYICNYYKW